MAHEFDPFIEAAHISQVVSPAALPIIRKMVAGLGGAERVFGGNNLFIQEYVGATAMFQAAEKIIEPGTHISGTNSHRLVSTAFRNGMKLPILAAKDVLHARTFNHMIEVGRPFVDPPAGLSLETAAQIAEHMTEHLGVYSEVGYQLLKRAYEPLVEAWEDVLSPTSGYGLQVRQGIGFVAGVLLETQARYLEVMAETVLDEAFPDAV